MGDVKRTPRTKKRACSKVCDIYESVRHRLAQERGKVEKDLSARNNIKAYTHIVRSLEDRYDLSGVARLALI